MQRGRKPTTNASKQLAGTLKPSRVRTEISVPVEFAIPLMPDYLTDGAKSVWLEEIDRIMSVSATELDSSLVARYCSLEAIVRDQFAKGDCPNIASLTELRRMGESLGLSGAQSRIGSASKPSEPTNPFARALTKQ
jgi:hypothetical protein